MSIRLYRDEFYPSIDLEVCQENIDLFFKFMYERHEIWRNRFIHKLPQEKWTDNPILKVTKYTNIYRELDRGTLWYLDNICKTYIDNYDSGNDSKIRNKNFELFKMLVWQTTIYRLCNRIETFEEVGFPNHLTYDSTTLHNDFYEKLEIISKRGEPVFTSAHLTCPTSFGYSKVEGYIAAICDLHKKLDTVCKDIINATKPEDVFYALKSVFCVGNFIAYEVFCDLMYSKSIGNKTTNVPFKEDDWANVGPGAFEGIRLTYPSTTGKKAIYDRMVQLRDEQSKHFERLGIKFNFYEKFTKGHLSLRSLEHSLCEFQKYWLQNHRLGKQRMIFTKDNNRIVGGYKFIIDPENGEHIKKIKVE